ncbi:MAG: DM13 domain-containing protein [bacterium]
MTRILKAAILLLTFGGVAAPIVLGAPATQPVSIATGKFAGTDDLHKGEGRALIVQLASGQRFLRFEEFKVTNGPDLYVYLSGHASPRNRTQLHDGGAFEVGLLKGNIGNQNYELPANLDLAKYKSVVIYCKRFSVLFASAELVFNR